MPIIQLGTLRHRGAESLARATWPLPSSLVPESALLSLLLQVPPHILTDPGKQGPQPISQRRRLRPGTLSINSELCPLSLLHQLCFCWVEAAKAGA